MCLDGAKLAASPMALPDSCLARAPAATFQQGNTNIAVHLAVDLFGRKCMDAVISDLGDAGTALSAGAPTHVASNARLIAHAAIWDTGTALSAGAPTLVANDARLIAHAAIWRIG